LLGHALFAIGAAVQRTGAQRMIRTALWLVPWLGGQVLIGALGRYGGGKELLPEWVDIGVVIAFALAIYYLAVRMALTKEQVAEAIAKDAHQLANV